MKIIKMSSISFLALVIIGMFLGQSCSSATYSTEDKRMEKIEKSAQFKDGKFFNLQNKYDINFVKTLPVLWDILFKDNNRKPKVELPTQQINFNNIINAKEDELKVTWVGHSSQIINIDGKIILTDPVFENRIVFMGPSRYNGDVPLKMDDLPEIDLVLITHNHYDHLNAETIKSINSKVKHFIAPLMVGAELEGMGVPKDKITELDWWEEIVLFDNFLIALTPTQHFSGRGIFDRDKTLWGSYVVNGPHHKIYFSGDSGYADHFKQIGDKYGPFDYTFLECGAYDERWNAIHMMPEETAQAHLDLKGDFLQPIHWGTFDLALHSWFDPMVRVAKVCDSLGIKLSTPIVGETININQELTTDRWWEKFLKNN